MPASKNLDFLLANMTPQINPGEYVFACVDEHTLQELSDSPILVFREKEAVTVILRKEVADAKSLRYEGVWGLITLSVNSSLSAIGFLAAVTRELAKASISVNAVSAVYHDHLFVPLDRVRDAMTVLLNLSNTRRK